MTKWKVYAHKAPNWNKEPMNVRMCGFNGGRRVLAIVAYRIEQVGNVKWEDIPVEYTEQNDQGWRFLQIRPELTIEDFELVLHQK